MVIRITSVVLQMLEPAMGEQFELALNVVDAKKSRTTPRGAELIHWRLLTNPPIKSNNDVERILRRYTQRLESRGASPHVEVWSVSNRGESIALK